MMRRAKRYFFHDVTRKTLLKPNAPTIQPLSPLAITKLVQLVLLNCIVREVVHEHPQHCERAEIRHRR